uniref:DUF4283 domain-containing protein n=1 Tax=Solanum tuberosum TaxID=4113 RepID=M1DFA8_SOLTU
MADDTIYFAVGFKSYDITRVVSKAETWYDWVERGRNRVTRMTVSQKTMEWLVYALKEASKVQGNSVRRWKVWDHSTEFFCSKNFNKDGRYISIIKTQGKRRAVIFIPEWYLNSGWMDISTKITRFINAKAQKISKVVHRKTEEGLLYSDSVRNNKWTTREINAAKIQQKGNSIIISEVTTKSQNELLEKSVVESLPEEIPNVTLSEVRRWVVSSWKHYHGINIYELGHNRFLFEFPNKTAADHTISGEWFWKSHKFSLEWWSPTSTATSERLNQVWIRVVGITLQLWSQKVFREIRNFCGGWIQTEEETELRNHLKWARLKIRGDGDDVSSFVELVHEGLTFKVQIWVEAPARIISDEGRVVLFKDQRSTERTNPKVNEKLLGFTEVSGHVGSSYDLAISKLSANTSRAGTHAPETQFKSPFKRNRLVHKGGKLGPDLLAQSILKEQTKESGPSFLIDPFTVELEANNISSTAVF